LGIWGADRIARSGPLAAQRFQPFPDPVGRGQGFAGGRAEIQLRLKPWILPSTESEYRAGTEALYRYLNRLADEKAYDGQFFTRADNLSAYLQVVEKRLGSLAQRLAASVGQTRFNVDLAGDPHARQSTPTPAVEVKTPWLKIDDYVLRGARLLLGRWCIR
jgi:hypothetical protein